MNTSGGKQNCFDTGAT